MTPYALMRPNEVTVYTNTARAQVLTAVYGLLLRGQLPRRKFVRYALTSQIYSQPNRGHQHVGYRYLMTPERHLLRPTLVAVRPIEQQRSVEKRYIRLRIRDAFCKQKLTQVHKAERNTDMDKTKSDRGQRNCNAIAKPCIREEIKALRA